MKKLYSLIIIVFLSVQANAQTFSHTPSQVLDVELTTNEFSNAQIDFATNPLGAITFGWQLINNDIPFGWSYSLCDYTNCYSGIPFGIHSMTPITGTEATNGTTGFLKITISPFEVEGTASVVVYVYDFNNSSNGDTITFNFTHASSLDIADETLDQISVYPNPAEDIITINNINGDMGPIQVINVLGEVVYSLTYNGSSMETIDISDFESGIYFVTYVNKDGIRETEKLMVK